MLIAIAALAATLMWRWARDISGSASAATFAWAAVALTAPFVFNSFTVYPEIPGALAVLIALAWRPDSTSVGVQLVRGICIGALPWLSTKYAVMAVAATGGPGAAHALECPIARRTGGAHGRSWHDMARVLLLDLGHLLAVSALRCRADDNAGLSGAWGTRPLFRSGVRRGRLRAGARACLRRTPSHASVWRQQRAARARNHRRPRRARRRGRRLSHLVGRERVAGAAGRVRRYCSSASRSRRSSRGPRERPRARPARSCWDSAWRWRSCWQSRRMERFCTTNATAPPRSSNGCRRRGRSHQCSPASSPARSSLRSLAPSAGSRSACSSSGPCAC